jgi:hypothetical protein
MTVSRWIVGVLMVGGLVVLAPNASASQVDTASPFGGDSCSDLTYSGCPGEY